MINPGEAYYTDLNQTPGSFYPAFMRSSLRVQTTLGRPYLTPDMSCGPPSSGYKPEGYVEPSHD